MKKSVSFILFFIISGIAYSQINKGQWMVGGSASFSNINIESDNYNSKTVSMNLSPGAGYFIVTGLAAGLNLGYSTYSMDNVGLDNFSGHILSLAPFIRFYVLPASGKVNVFANASYTYRKTKQNYSFSNEHGYIVQAGPSVFLNDHVALEFTIGYQSALTKEGDFKTKSFQSGLGLQIHLGSGKKKRS